MLFHISRHRLLIHFVNIPKNFDFAYQRKLGETL